MRKVVVNSQYGGFSLSQKAVDLYKEKTGVTLNQYDVWDTEVDRDDPALVQVVEELGKDANGECAALKIVEIPEDVDWFVQEYDGAEWVAEKHRTWF